jgi:serine/threonine-protein kinase
VLRSTGRLDEAIPHAERAVELAPGSALFRYNFATYLKAAGRRDEAATQFEQARGADAGFAPAHHGLGVLRLEDGRLDEAVELLRRAIVLAPNDGRSYGALGAALLAQGRFSEARAAVAHGVELFASTDPARAAAERQLNQCELMITLDARLPAVVRGEERPASAKEKLQFAVLCRLRKYYAAAARLAAEAFDESPPLAEDLRAQRRYNAACAAALAGRGVGGDAAVLDAPARARLRRQAVAWLRADLGAWAEAVDRGPRDRAAARRALTHWRTDPDLAGVRDPAELNKLPAAERADWAALWTDVDALLPRVR